MHFKRYLMPKFWPVAKKAEKFITTPAPGPHAKRESMPVVVLIRDVLGFAGTAGEARGLLNRGEVKVDCRVVKDPKFPVGLMDTVEFVSAKKRYRMVPHTVGLALTEIGPKEACKKLCMIKRKTVIKGGKTQITLHDGRNMLVGKDSGYRNGDSLLIELPGQKILHHWQIKEGVPAIVFRGKNSGISGRIKSVHEKKRMQEKSRVVIETKDGDIETLKDYVLAGEAA